MNKIIDFYRETAERSRGQALVVIAVSFVALLLFVGLAIDGGMILVNYGNLRRSVDAASLAAASQVRDSTTLGEIELVARSTMQLNGVQYDAVNLNITVKTCDDTTGTPAQFQNACTGSVPRKLIYVQGEIDSELAFMRLLGFTTIPLSAWSVGEAAAVDVVLLIDVSDSMAGDPVNPENTYYTTHGEVGDWSENPDFCNSEGNNPLPGGSDMPCMPFHFVKQAAVGFAQNVLDKDFNGFAGEEDRIGIVTFANGFDFGYTREHDINGNRWSDDYSDVEAALNALTVYPGSGVCNKTSSTPSAHIGKCREESGFPTDFAYLCGPAVSEYFDYGQGIPLDPVPPGDPDYSTCGTTSIGSGLLVASSLLVQSSMDRPNAIRVVVLLTDGANNATGPKAADCTDFENCDVTGDIHPLLMTSPYEDNYWGYCPEGLGKLCRDNDVFTRNRVDLSTWPECPMLLHGDNLTAVGECPSTYDADDFAMDVAEAIGCPAILPATTNCRDIGQGAIIFTIGMGPQVSGGSVDSSGNPFGAHMLRFIASVGEDGEPLGNTGGNVNYDTSEDTCQGLYDNQTEYETSCGNYYFAQDATYLPPVFEAIAARIFTRIAQ
ncbi:MAG: hypothetical protein DWQ07_12005 [Chloroflexi bacterium]|nr:MAG: hypothetical protein DWQ07_12005 [Chloroflexota bacterium]MBL1196082.1 hypothetical protein [Chloroflexota bacterium]NOH13376.1 hypothetical protein [Chloroflexota bacterium]